jgi:methionyl-tRNA formyltransferase
VPFFDSTPPQPIGRIVFIGAVHEARAALAVLLESRLATIAAVVTATPDGLAKLAGGVDLAALAEPAGVPVIRTEDVNAAEMVNTVRCLAPDLLVVVGWTRLIAGNCSRCRGAAALASMPRCCPRTAVEPRSTGRSCAARRSPATP